MAAMNPRSPDGGDAKQFRLQLSGRRLFRRSAGQMYEVVHRLALIDLSQRPLQVEAV
jgi:hypothetical protein